MISIYLLGAPQIEVDSVPVQVDTRKAIAILAYLAVGGERHTRDAIAALLWEEYDAVHARGALRRTLSALNKALQGQSLRIEGGLIGLDLTQGVWVDVVEFNRLLASCASHGHSVHQVCPKCPEPLQAAVALYRGDFLAGFSLRDSVAFDDWQFFQTETLRRSLSGALERLVQVCAVQEDYPSAIAYAQRWLSLDSLHEPAHRRLMSLYALSGQRNAALRQYHECARILDKELGVPPLEETTRLYLEIKEKRDDRSALPQKAGAEPTLGWGSQPENTPTSISVLEKPGDEIRSQPGFTSLPFIGREPEWRSLQQAYHKARSEGYFVVLEGEAGIGKTRLAEEYLAYARSQGAEIIQTRCFEGEDNLAYAPFVDGLAKAIEQTSRPDWHIPIPPTLLSEAARLLPTLSRLRNDLPVPAPSESPGAQTRFFAGLSEVIWSLCAGQSPGVLFIDDIHWADEASLDLLTYLVRRLSGHPLFILATWRSEDLDSGHRLRRLLADAQRNGYGELLSLSRLDARSIEALVQASSTGLGTESTALSQKLYQETEGLPFFVVEYLAALPANREQVAPEEWGMPYSVRDLLRSRLVQIDETGWQLLQAAAVIGRSFDFDTLRATSGRAEDETISTLEALINRGLIREIQFAAQGISPESSRPPGYDFSHEKLREFVYGETSLARKRLLHLRAAEALVSHSRSLRDQIAHFGQIAYHYKQGGCPREAAVYYLRAGEQARAVYANIEALGHFQAALAMGHPDIALVNEAIGDMQLLLGHYRPAINSFEAALAQLNLPRDIARLKHKLGKVYHRLGEWEHAEACYQICLEALESDANVPLQAGVYADWSLTAYQRRQIERAGQMAEKALALAETADDALSLAQAHNILGILSRNRNELQQAASHLEQSLSLANRLAHPGARIAALNNLSLVYADQGDLNRAIEYAQQALDLCASLGDRHREAALHNNLADLYHLLGRREDSMTHLKQAVAIFSEVDGMELRESETGGEQRQTHLEIWKLTEW